MMQNYCYEKCYNISKLIYNFFIFLSFRTKPQLEKNDDADTDTTKKMPCKYCELCDLDDYLMEVDLEQNN
jgi:hypothetical protein